MAYPNELKYTREHEWVKVEGKTATVGITNYAQDQLGDIVFVELPKVGTEVTKGKSFGTVESVKSVSEIFAPLSGKVTAVNEALATAPEKINQDAHGSWMIRIEASDPGEANGMLSAADYEKFISEEQGK
jgi:glycine cleavage system H protein